jgi:aspartyl-tRNA(Asn)/glutamyl-tRNA(Gln) amidotransferase subunit A
MKSYELTIHELHDLLVKKEVTSREVTEALYRRIKETDGKIRAYLMMTEKEAFRQADQVDRKIAKGEGIGDLAGIPLGLKDILCIKGIRTTCGSKILENYVPFYDGTVVKKLKERDAVILGKLNMDEFAMGSSTENSGFQITRNPWDLNRIPGGSSGGSAAAVAAHECIAALGYRRFDPAACLLLRCSRDEADLWKGIEVWSGGFRLLIGSDWPDHKRCGGLCYPDECDQWLRPS